MKAVLIAAMFVALCGCHGAAWNSEDNDSVIRETKKCHAADMDAVQNPYGDIICTPKESRTLAR